MNSTKNIFKLMDEGEDFEHLLNLKSLSKVKTERGMRCNALTYAFVQGHDKAVETIINFVATSPNKDALSDILLNGESLHDIVPCFYQRTNHKHIQAIITQFTLDEKQKNFLLNIVMNTLLNKREHGYDLEEIHRVIPKIKVQTYDDIKTVEKNVPSLHGTYKHVIDADFAFNLRMLKDFISCYELYHPHEVLHGDDKNRNELKVITDSVDAMVMKAQSEADVTRLFSQDIAEAINTQHQASKNKYIFYAKTRSTLYLKQDVSFNKLKLYSELYKTFKEHDSMEDVFEHVFKHHYIKERLQLDPLHKTHLSELLTEKRFKSITVAKDAKNEDVEKVIAMLESGTRHVQRIYGLEPEDVGGTKLSLLFDTRDIDESGMKGAASIIPGADLITYSLEHLDDLGDRHFVHEFSHYLQDKKFYLSNMRYDEAGLHALDDNSHWAPLNQAISQTQSTQEDALDYSNKLLKVEMKHLSPEQHESLMQVIKFNLDKSVDTCESAIRSTLEGFWEGCESDWYGKEYKLNGMRVGEEEVTSLVNSLVLLHKAHHSGSFLKTLWSGLDQEGQGFYVSNQMETHSRLTEMLTGIKGRKEYNFLHYPTDNLMAPLKPKLEAFNRMLAAHYVSHVVPYKPRSSHRDEALCDRPAKSSFNFYKNEEKGEIGELGKKGEKGNQEGYKESGREKSDWKKSFDHEYNDLKEYTPSKDYQDWKKARDQEYEDWKKSDDYQDWKKARDQEYEDWKKSDDYQDWKKSYDEDWKSDQFKETKDNPNNKEKALHSMASIRQSLQHHDDSARLPANKA